MVTGNEMPLKTNSELFDDPDVTVTFDPAAAKVPVRLELRPTVTLPKFNDVGDTDKVAGFVPVPESGIESVGFGAFDVRVRLPLALPEPPGANVTVKLAVCPGVNVRGRLRPLKLNPAPEMEAWLMV